MSVFAVPSWRRAAQAILALLLLNGLLSFNNVWPTPAIVPDHRLAPEFVGLWLGLLFVVARRRAPSSRMLAGFTVVFMLLVLGRYGDVTVPALFGRPVNLYWDGQQIPRFLWVSAQSLPWWMSMGAVAAVVLLMYAIYRLFGMFIRIAARDAASYALRTRWAQIVTALAVLLVIANIAGVRATWPVVSRAIVPTYWRQATLLTTIFTGQRAEQTLPRADALDVALAARPGTALAGLRGSDVYLIPLESYGAVVYDRPETAARLRPARERLAADIAAGGFEVVSAFMRSPTFGGASDLAQLGMLSGLDLSDPLRHDLLLTTDRPTLITLFRANGYRTFGFYPALFWDWPERVFYGYDQFVEGRGLDYPGPEFGYWKIPDQYAAARFEQLFPRDADSPPRFVFFPAITCHLPFNPVPPYQTDPQKLLGGTPFDPADSARALAVKPDWLNMLPGYVAMVEYTYRWLGDYLRQPQPRETVYILVGDHQPAASVSGEGASWDVPVHIVSRDPALLARFTAQGFHAGLEPPREARGGLHDLTTMMLRAFAQP